VGTEEHFDCKRAGTAAFTDDDDDDDDDADDDDDDDDDADDDDDDDEDDEDDDDDDENYDYYFYINANNNIDQVAVQASTSASSRAGETMEGGTFTTKWALHPCHFTFSHQPLPPDALYPPISTRQVPHA
jgi:hypothetical protein